MSHDTQGNAASDPHHDPLHDIDGPRTTYAVVGSLVVIVALMWLMSRLYAVVVQVERQAKIGDVEATELHKINKPSLDELAGKHKDRGAKTIDQAIQEYLAK